MVAAHDSYSMKAAVVTYLVSWGVLSGFIMLNIVMAVLVESFTAAQREMRQELLASRQRQRLFTPVVDPMRRLIAKWLRATSEQASAGSTASRAEQRGRAAGKRARA